MPGDLEWEPPGAASNRYRKQPRFTQSFPRQAVFPVNAFNCDGADPCFLLRDL